MTTTLPGPSMVSVQDQVPALLGQVAGYVGHRTIAMGLRTGLIRELDTVDTAGSALSADELAARLGLDAGYVAVWCRAALAAGLCERDPADPDRYRLAPHMGTLLLDTGHPGYLGGVFEVLERPEVFDRFERHLADGARMWWSDCSPEWIDGVAGTGAPFYTRLIPGGLDRIAGLPDLLAAGCRVADTACGSGAGLVRLAQTYPACRIVGVDGDQHSLRVAAERLRAAGIAERCDLVHSALEEFALDEQVAVAINNISMHECRNLDAATDRMREALQPGGYLVISDFPFPDTVAGLQSVPGRVMSGIQFFEAQIDDQLLPRSVYPELLARHGFVQIGQFDLGGVHAVTHGRVPGGAGAG